MKKAIIAITAVFLLGFSSHIHASELPETDPLVATSEAPVETAQPMDGMDYNIDVMEPVDGSYYDSVPIDPAEFGPRLSDGARGCGTITDPLQYWTENGYPNNISYVFEAGGQVEDDDVTISVYWEIGIVNGDDAAKQAIVDLFAPTCLITFWDCAVSYAQREAVFNEIYASRNEIVRDAVMIRNNETIQVEIADGYEKEYARMYIEKYGAFVGVTNDINAGYKLEGATYTGMDQGMGERSMGKNSLYTWLWPVSIVLVIVAGGAVLVTRSRALQTNNGQVVTSGRMSRKQVVAAVKDSAVSPSADVFQSIMKKVGA